MKLNLKELRKAKRLTQRQVAEMAGMSVSYYTELELGTKQINAFRLEQLSKVLGTTPQGLIAGHEADRIQLAITKMAMLSAQSQSLVEQLIDSLLTVGRSGDR